MTEDTTSLENIELEEPIDQARYSDALSTGADASRSDESTTAAQADADAAPATAQADAAVSQTDAATPPASAQDPANDLPTAQDSSGKGGSADEGDPADKNNATGKEDFEAYADLSGFDVMATELGEAGAGNASSNHPFSLPDRTGVMAPVRGMRNAYEYRAPKAEKNYLAKPLKIALSLVALMLIAAGIGLLAQPDTRAAIQERIDAATSSNAEASSSDAAQETEPAASASSDVSSAGISDARAVVDDDTAFEYLVNTYDKLQSYNDRVYSCLQTYNSTIVANDRTQREAAAGIASSLLGEIDKDMKTLDAMNIGNASELFDDYQNVRNLLNDQYQRLAVVVESWDISLKYDRPYEHQTEILEPLTRDLSYSGQNIYLEDFDANYWNSRPVR